MNNTENTTSQIRKVLVSVPADAALRLRAQAKARGRIFSSYIAEILVRAAGRAEKGAKE